MPKSQPNGEFIHSGSCPHAVAILDAVCGGRDVPGIAVDPPGISVDWDRLTSSWLSITETAAIRLARVVAAMERHGGGFPPHVAEAVAVACAALTGTGAAPAGPPVRLVVPDTEGLLRACLDGLAEMLWRLSGDDPTFGPWATAATRLAGVVIEAEAQPAPTLETPAGVEVASVRHVAVDPGDIGAAASAAAAIRRLLGDPLVDEAVDWADTDHPAIAPTGVGADRSPSDRRVAVVDRCGRAVALLAALAHTVDVGGLARLADTPGPHRLTVAEHGALVRLVRLVVAVLHPDTPGIAAYGYLGH